MAFSRNILLATILILGISHQLLAQTLLRNTIAETVRSCYQNATALNRASRQPMHIDNFIAIIRKLEKKTDYLWDIRRLSRTIINRFQYDGMQHDPDKGIDLQYYQNPNEVTKTTIIQSLIPSSDVFQDDWLDNDERCALHWMLSTSLNATRRDDQEFERYGRYSEGLRARRATNVPQTNQPVETGVVYTPWGDISAGRMLGGIAAALEEQEVPVVYKPNIGPNSVNPNPGNGNNNPNNNNNNNGGTNNQFPGSNNYNYNNNNNRQWSGRKKRQVSLTFANLKGIHAATLAGDIGQAAIHNAQYALDGRPLPEGTWNDTICPREFVLNALPDPTADGHHDHDTWTYMTASEIRGGMDGLILASKIRDLSNQGYKLSQVLEMYYSQQGIVGESGFRSCDRGSLYSGRVDNNILREQARSFAYYYNFRVHGVYIDDNNPSIFENLVTKSLQKLNSFNPNTKPCDSRYPSGGGGVEIPDRDKLVKPMTTVYAILDYSSTMDELINQTRLIAKMAFELNVSPKGSRLGLVSGQTGQLLISPNFTDNAAVLACRVLSERRYTASTNLVQALRVLKTELRKVRDEEARTGYNDGVGNGAVILVFVQGQKLPEGQRNDILTELREYSNEFGDTRIIYVSSKYQKSDFDNFVLNKDEENFILIQRGPGELSDSSGVFLKDLLQKSHGKLHYPRCDTTLYPDQRDELKLGNDFFVNPNSMQYYAVSPDYFYRSIDMRFRFTSDNGKVRVCLSQTNQFPSKEKNEHECRETSGTWEDPMTTKSDVEFTITKPCKSQERAGCRPLYISVTPTSFPAPGSIGFDCSIHGCDSPDQVKVTWTHYGMRCGAFKMAVSGPVVFVAAIASILYKFNFL